LLWFLDEYPTIILISLLHILTLRTTCYYYWTCTFLGHSTVSRTFIHNQCFDFFSLFLSFCILFRYLFRNLINWNQLQWACYAEYRDMLTSFPNTQKYVLYTPDLLLTTRYKKSQVSGNITTCEVKRATELVQTNFKFEVHMQYRGTLSPRWVTEVVIQNRRLMNHISELLCITRFSVASRYVYKPGI
jgi:hypothetical protein